METLHKPEDTTNHDLALLGKAIQHLSDNVAGNKLAANFLDTVLDWTKARKGGVYLRFQEYAPTQAMFDQQIHNRAIEISKEEAQCVVLPSPLFQRSIKSRSSLFWENPSFKQEQTSSLPPSSFAMCIPFPQAESIHGVLYLESDLSQKTTMSQKRSLIEVLANFVACQFESQHFKNQLGQKTQELELEKRMFHGVINNLPDFILVKNVDNQYVVANQAYLQIIGEKSAENVIGKTDFDYLPSNHAAGFREDDWKVMETLKPIEYQELESLKQGKNVWYSSTKVPWMDEQGNVLGVIIIGREITEQRNTKAKILELNKELEKRVEERTLELQEALKQLEEKHKRLMETQTQLVQSEKMASLGILVAGVAHEINNPINFIFSGAQNLESYLHDLEAFIFEVSEDATEEEVREIFNPKMEPLHENLGAILRGVHRVVTLIKDLSMFSRVDQLGKTKADIVEGIQSTLAIVKSNYKNYVQFICDLEEQIILECWSAQLNQVFMNLLVNGCQSIVEKQKKMNISPPGTITVKSFFQNNTVGIRIEDTGTGMDEETQKHIFEPFYTTKPVGEGTGLGLSISYGVIERHQGRIDVESVVGQGTAMSVVLPYYQKEM